MSETVTATVIVSVAVLAVIALALILGRRLSVRFGQLEASVHGTQQTVQDIDRAVNHRPPGDPTLYESARRAAAGVEECRRTLDDLRELPPKVDRISQDLRSHLDWHDTTRVDLAD